MKHRSLEVGKGLLGFGIKRAPFREGVSALDHRATPAARGSSQRAGEIERKKETERKRVSERERERRRDRERGIVNISFKSTGLKEVFFFQRIPYCICRSKAWSVARRKRPNSYSTVQNPKVAIFFFYVIIDRIISLNYDHHLEIKSNEHLFSPSRAIFPSV